MSFLSSIINIGREIEHGIEQAGHTVAKAVNEVEHTVERAVSTTVGQVSRPVTDLSAMMRRQQLQGSIGGSRAAAGIAAVSSTQPKSSGSFLSGLGSLFTGVVGQLASIGVNKLASLLPAPLVETGIKIASQIFGGQGGRGIESDVASHLREFGVDQRGISAARVFYNSPNAIPGYATTLGTDIHFGSTINPKYWQAASELDQLIKSGASPEAIHNAQNKLRDSISDFGLIAHETNHVAQFKRDGSVGFAARYAGDFAGGFVSRVLDQALAGGGFDAKKIFDLNDHNAPLGGAYRGVSYEQESYPLGDNIEAQLLARYDSLLSY